MFKGCGGTFTAREGTIQSPNYPANYSNDQECVYVISRPEGERITLTFEDFDLEGGSRCEFDSLLIRDGSSENSPVIGRYCGTQNLTEKLSFGNALWLKFESDTSDTRKGFTAKYTSGVVPQNFLLVADDFSGSLYRIDIKTGTNILIPLRLHRPFAVDFDPLEERIYWTNAALGEIRSAYLNGSDQSVVWTSPNREAVDPLSRLVFYVDPGNDVIGMITTSGSVHKAIITQNIEEPRSIALDTANGVMFWTDVGDKDNTGKIERANYDGTDRRTLVSLEPVPNGLALDLQNKRLYWVDALSERIESIGLDGRNRQLIRTIADSHLFGLALQNETLYMTEWGSSRHQTTVSHMYRMQTDGSGLERWLRAQGKMDDVHAYGEDSWEQGPNGCSSRRNVCGDICIPSPGNSYKCLCPDGLYLGSDGRTCN
ncbi:hypothetical protein BaRGS_00025393, partial [Batillaria attramentaria]